MKKIILVVAALAAFTTNAQTVIFEDNFESYTPGDNVGEDIDVPTDYTNYDVDADTFGWGLANTASFTQPFGDIYDNNFILSASFITTGAGGNGGDGALSPNNILVLPLISIPSDANGTQLSYFVGSGTDPNFFSETYSVQVTTTNDQADILAATPELMTTLAAQGGETVTLDLSAYEGQDVYVSFRHYDTTDQFLLGLDDISVTTGLLGVESQVFENFNYAVNGSNQLMISANNALENIELYNIIGQQVLSQKLSNNNATVNLSNLVSGVYIATVSIDNQNKSFKIIKN